MMIPLDDRESAVMSDEADVADFLSYWFCGFAKGLEDLDASSRTTLLRECGQACARSYTAQIFRESWQRAGGDMARFLAELGTGQTQGNPAHKPYVYAPGQGLFQTNHTRSPQDHAAARSAHRSPLLHNGYQSPLPGQIYSAYCQEDDPQ